MSVLFDAPTNPAFEYQQADSWDEAIELLGLWGEEGKLIAGGQSLVPMLNLRLAAPGALIDINPVGPQEPWIDGNELVIPALTRHIQVVDSDLVRQYCPMLVHAVRLIGNVRVRNRGTMGGSVAHADPTGEIPCALVSAAGRVVVQGPAGSRSFTADEFFVTYLTTAADLNEVVTEVRIPLSAETQGWGFEEVTRRHSDFATVAVASAGPSRNAEAPSNEYRVVIAGVADRPLLLEPAALEPLHAGDVTQKTVEDVASNAADVINPESDVHASADYRRTITRALVKRTLLTAAGLHAAGIH